MLRVNAEFQELRDVNTVGAKCLRGVLLPVLALRNVIALGLDNSSGRV
jgi:hypothetical protein